MSTIAVESPFTFLSIENHWIQKPMDYPESNPYAAPQTTGGPEPGPEGSDEQIRNYYLKHEASVLGFASLFFIGGVLTLLGSVLITFGMVFERNGGEPTLGMFFAVLIVFYIGFGAFYLSVAISLRKLKTFGRISATILATIGLLGFPVGTLLSAYLLYLLWSEKGKFIFSEQYRGVRERTPHVKYKTHIVVKILLVIFLALFSFGVLSIFFVG